MNKIKFNCFLQKDLLIDVTYQDSNEDPEIDCVNTIVSIKLGNKIYQYFNQDPKDALNKFKSMLEATIAFSPIQLPEVAFVLISKYKSDLVIDWDAIERIYSYKSKGVNTVSNVQPG